MDIRFDELKETLKSQERKLDVISNNLSNINSTGFKRELVFIGLLRDKGKDLVSMKIVPDFREGPLEKTDNPLDFAISGRGLFAVIKSDGEERYTRNGHFKVDAEGFLVTPTGEKVLGKSGPINVSIDGLKPGKVEVSPFGRIYVDSEYIDDFKIVDFEDYSVLRKDREGFYYAGNRSGLREVEEPHIIQGTLEASNVNPVDEMIEMITLHRHFESTQKAIKALDEQLRKTVNDVGKYKTA